MKCLKPLGKRLLVQIQDTQQSVVKGIIVPVGTLERFTKAEVHIVGDGVEEIHANDFVLIDRYLGSEVEFGDVKYLLVKEVDILAIYQ